MKGSRSLASLLIVFILSIVGASRPLRIAQAATCSGAGCNMASPEATGCATDGQTHGYASISGVGTVELRWSPACQAYWTRVKSNNLSEETIAWVYNDRYPDKNFESRHFNTSMEYSFMSAPAGTRVQACGNIHIGITDHGACAVRFGEGTSNVRAFGEAYHRNGGTGMVGSPAGGPFRENGGWMQNFNGGAGEASVITLADSNTSRAFYVHNGIARSYQSAEFRSKLGYPTSDEFVAGRSPTGATGWGQDFQRGVIHWYNGQGYYTVNTIMQAYRRCGGSSGRLGFPTSNELVTSFGWQSNFELGRIEAYPGRAPRVFDRNGQQISC